MVAIEALDSGAASVIAAVVAAVAAVAGGVIAGLMALRQDRSAKAQEALAAAQANLITVDKRYLDLIQEEVRHALARATEARDQLYKEQGKLDQEREAHRATQQLVAELKERLGRIQRVLLAMDIDLPRDIRVEWERFQKIESERPDAQ